MVLTFHDGVDAGATTVTVVATVVTQAVESYSGSLSSALKGEYEYPWFDT